MTFWLIPPPPSPQKRKHSIRMRTTRFSRSVGWGWADPTVGRPPPPMHTLHPCRQIHPRQTSLPREHRCKNITLPQTSFTGGTKNWAANILYMSHFAYACKMRYPLNLVLESWEYLWFYWTFCIVILDYGLKLHKLSNNTLVMLQKWLEIH